MLSSRAVICLLLATVAFADVNKVFEDVLQGKESLQEAHIDQMYEQFLHQYKDGTGQTPSGTFLRSSLVDRKRIFAESVNDIVKHNSDPTYKYKKGINSYADMTNEEFNEYFHLVKDPQHCSATEHTATLLDKKFDLQDIPQHFDWRTVGGVTPVKNQGHCGSCWTFSTIGCMEAHYMIKYNQFRNLSEQQLVDCAAAFDNHGCNGGLPSHAFEYIHAAGGITTEDQYPYTAVTGDKCNFNSTMASVGVVGGSVNVTVGDETELLHAVFEHGPVSIAYQVVDGFKAYKSGVYHSDVCNNTAADVNHAVLAVGFGTEDGMDYWIVKNSWGTSWGDNGYFKIQRGVNMCGVSNCNSFPKDVVDTTKDAFIVPSILSTIEKLEVLL